MSLIPVTILTGFLCSRKTTLLNHILKGDHGERIAVIENEFGETGIDNELLVQDRSEHIVEMNNGCICCTVRVNLVRILGKLAAKRRWVCSACRLAGCGCSTKTWTSSIASRLLAPSPTCRSTRSMA